MKHFIFITLAFLLTTSYNNCFSKTQNYYFVLIYGLITKNSIQVIPHYLRLQTEEKCLEDTNHLNCIIGDNAHTEYNVVLRNTKAFPPYLLEVNQAAVLSAFEDMFKKLKGYYSLKDKLFSVSGSEISRISTLQGLQRKIRKMEKYCDEERKKDLYKQTVESRWCGLRKRTITPNPNSYYTRFCYFSFPYQEAEPLLAESSDNGHSPPINPDNPIASSLVQQLTYDQPPPLYSDH